MSLTMLVLKDPSAQSIVTAWLDTNNFSYKVTTTPHGSKVIISDGNVPFFTQLNLKSLDPKLGGCSIQGSPTSIILDRLRQAL